MIKLQFIICLYIVSICSCFAQNRNKHTISDYITTFSEERVIKNANGWAFWFIPPGGIADTLSVKMSFVDTGEKTHEPHTHFEDELFYMVEGTSIVHLNGEEQVLNPGDAFYAPGNSSHNIRRTNSSPIKYVMFKREINGKLDKPFLPGIQNYTMKDCLVPFRQNKLVGKQGDKTMWYLTKRMSVNGLNAQLHIQTGSEASNTEKDSSQGVYFILEGNAIVTVNDESKNIKALSSCYFPVGSNHSIQKIEGDTLKYIIVKTK